MVAIAYRLFELPWASFGEDDERLRNIMLSVMMVCLVLATVIPWIPLTKPEREKLQPVPPRLAQLVLERQKPQPPRPPLVKPEPPKPEPRAEAKPKPKLAEKPKTKEKPVVKAQAKPKPVPKPELKPEPQIDRVAAAREKAASSGLLAFADELADLRDDAVVSSLSKAQPLAQGEVKAQSVKRNILASAPANSGGIDTSRLRAAAAKGAPAPVALATRQSTQVSNLVKVAARQVSSAKPSVAAASKAKPRRSYEEITLVIDKSKGAIFSLYNRALRQDPTLQGKVVLEITITPDGRVTRCAIVSSDLNDAELERKLLARIKLLKFAPRNVETAVVTYPIDFLPS